MINRLTFTALLVWLAVGCGDAGPVAPYASEGGGAYEVSGSGGDYGGDGSGASSIPAAPADADCVDTPTYEEVAAFNTCVRCHDSTKAGVDRKSAPVNVNFNTEADADAHSLQAVSMVMKGAMPPPSTGLKLSDAEKQQLYTWAMCKM
jgi:hypothetical protein